MQILIVEDDYATSFTIKTVLSLIDNTESIITEYAEEVEDICRTQEISLIIMDIMLKGDMDGLTAAEQLRKNNNLPIIFISALTDSQTRERIGKLTNCYHISKPFNGEDLAKKVQSHLPR